MNILILAYYFPPFNTIASHRPYSWARAWGQMGHEVTVLCPDDNYGDLSLTKSMEGFDVYRVPRYRIHEKVLRKGRSSLESKDKNQSKDRLHAIKQFITTISSSKGILRELRMPSFADLWIHPAKKSIAIIFKNKRQLVPWDLVISSSNPYAVHVLGAFIKRKGWAKKFFMDFRDLWTESPVYPGIWPFKFWEQRLEKKLLTIADGCITVGQHLADSLSKKTLQPVLVCYNGYEVLENQGVDEQMYPSSKQVLAYTGALYRKHRDPTVLFQMLSAWQETEPDMAKNIHLAFAGKQVDHLEELINDYQVQDFVTYYGPVSYAKAMAMQEQAQALLFLESDLPESQGNITGKLFEYLQKKKPIAAVGITDKSEAWDIMEKAGVGYLLRTQQDFFHFFNQLANANVQSDTKLEIGNYSRSSLATHLMKELEAIIKS